MKISLKKKQKVRIKEEKIKLKKKKSRINNDVSGWDILEFIVDILELIFDLLKNDSLRCCRIFGKEVHIFPRIITAHVRAYP